MRLVCSQEWWLRADGLYTLANYAAQWWSPTPAPNSEGKQ